MEPPSWSSIRKKMKELDFNLGILVGVVLQPGECMRWGEKVVGVREGPPDT